MNSKIECLSLFLFAATFAPAAELKFAFSASFNDAGYTAVSPDMSYTAERGFGLRAVTPGSAPYQMFAVDVAEGNYAVTMQFGDVTSATSTMVRAEGRRLMLERVDTAPRKIEKRSFTVNVRKPAIGEGRSTKLNAREMGPPISPSWDAQLTLEFNGAHPGVLAVEIAPAPACTTVFIAGDSTVTDQSYGPYAGWGQMLPRFFQSDIALSNHAESGLALSSFSGQRRLDKVLSMMKAGDYLFIQFGHNDQKDKSPNAGPFTTYKASLLKFIEATRSRGGIPVLVTPMERRRWEGDRQTATLTDYAEAVRQAAVEAKAPVIDLNEMSLKLYAALGAEGSKQLFVHHPANTFLGQSEALRDDTHHSLYGGYELARCMVEGIKLAVPDLAKHLLPGIAPFDPKKPDSLKQVGLPIGPFQVANEKPAGS
jgi:lysophospholipase L1-like esterase